MKILFITLGGVSNFSGSGIYTDLLKKFSREGHEVFVVGSIEKRYCAETELTQEFGVNVLRVKIGNITKTNMIEKGISTIMIGRQYQKAIEKFFNNVLFDLILYTTPPITIAGVVRKLKKKYNSFTYLLLKDIFPQNAIDIGILSKKGIKGLIYLYFKLIEKQLYDVSDCIGCMSQANIDFIIREEGINKDKVEICPNTLDVIETIKVKNKDELLEKYNIPKNKYLLLYGGNFGKPQSVTYIVEVLKKASVIENIHFILCGSGTDYSILEKYYMENRPSHVTLMNHLPYKEYAKLVSVCDMGLLFLDYRFTIPNYPSRLLDYMNYSLPVIAATDINTDVGEDIVEGDFGWWIESRDPDEYIKLLKAIFENSNIKEEISEKSRNAKKYLIENFETSRAYDIIIKSYYKEKCGINDVE